jgi:hypothetical protein
MRKISERTLVLALIVLIAVAALATEPKSPNYPNNVGEASGEQVIKVTDSRSSITRDRQTCPAEALFGQESYPPPNPRFSTSQFNVGGFSYIAYDNFANASGVTSIRWWGIQAYDPTRTWLPCTFDPADFEIKFYVDGGELPGGLAATYLVTVSATPTGVFFSQDGSDFELMEWETALTPPPAVGDEMMWVSIQGSASGPTPCWFRWVWSPDGDQIAYYENEGVEGNTLSTDFAFCLMGEAGYVCGDADGNEIVNISDAVYLISYIFGGGPGPDPLQSGDCDCNDIVNISDAVYLIAYIFGGGPEPCECGPPPRSLRH